jgi:membrane associated rhomboid family serine protease
MHLEPLTLRLLWATLGCLVLWLLPDAIQQQMVLYPLALNASDAGGWMAVLGQFRPWQVATHLLINGAGELVLMALTFYFFGNMLEGMWGARRYGLFLLTCAIGAALVQLAVSTATFAFGITPGTPIAGAAGPMYAILFALAYIVPYQEVRLILPPVRMTMRTMAIVFIVIAFVLGVKGQGWFAQFGFLSGMGLAWLHIRYWRGLPPFRRKPPKQKKRHLHSV